MPRKVEISHRTIIFAALFVGFLWLVFIIRGLILQLFIALLLTAILNPLVEWLFKYKIPKAVSVFVAYVLFFSIVGGLIAVIVPPLVEQTSNLVNSLPKNLENSGFANYVNDEVLKQLLSQLGSIPTQIVKAGVNVFTNVLSVLTVLIFAFYMLLTREKTDKTLKVMFGKERGAKFTKMIALWEEKLGGWARGQLILMLLVGVLSYIGLLLLGIPYALPLAVLAGVLEIIPYFGPIIAAFPAVIIGFSQSPFLGFATVALVFLIQQLENYLIVPKVMEKSAGISPIVTLFALSVGFKLAGIAGAIISIPVVITVEVLIQQGILRK